MKISEHFTLEEFYKSATAKRKGINNFPDEKTRENIKKLVENVLEPIRQEYGHPIVITSGYRCPELNKAVGGVAKSQHLTGSAADIHSLSDKLEDNMVIWRIIEKMVKEEKITTGQYIFEYGQKATGPDWIHISIPGPRQKNINQKIYVN